MGPLAPNPVELVLGLVCFFFVFLVLGRRVLPRIERTLAEREEATGGRLAVAERIRHEALELRGERRAQLDAARHEAARIRQTAAEEGAALVAAARAEAQREREELVTAAQVQLAASRVIAEAELREDVVTSAVELAGRVVGEPLAGLPRTEAAVARFRAELEAAD
ncbi:hypothetical protein, partial [Streptomyces sp. NRRL B-24484]|uniref:F0F1 ATP synthase subunit B family protein n=1 Tax=Streptomyces sp. NRRL B-24484 TaxID=1463833 RepID=UPI0004C09E29